MFSKSKILIALCLKGNWTFMFYTSIDLVFATEIKKILLLKIKSVFDPFQRRFFHFLSLIFVAMILFYSMRFFYCFIFFSSLLSAQYNFENLELRMRQFVAEKELVGFQTMIIKEEKVVHYDNYGFSDIEKEKPLQDNSIFRIASITKCIVAVGIMKLYDKGYFNLEDPIGQYILEYKNP